MARYRSEQWHTLPPSEVLSLLESEGTRGLSAAEAARRLQDLGPNVLLSRKGPSAFIRFLNQFQHPLIYVLLAAGGVMIFLPGHLVDAGVIFGVVLVNALIGYFQETHAKAAIEALKRMVTIETTVVREGECRKVEASDLVPGDLVLLESGDRVPADLRVLRARELSIDEAMLTGESLPVRKDAAMLPLETPLADRRNMAYSGTLATSGQGAGLVVATGNDTQLGHISHLIARAETIATPLTRRIARFSMSLTWVILGLAGLTFIAGLLHGDSLADTFLAAVALAVAAIPEGLPAAITIILAIGVTRMAERHAILRKLPAVETLGSTRIICSDKTGTLTKNEMTVTAIALGASRFHVTGVGYRPEGELLQEGASPRIAGALEEVLVAGALCNDSRLREDPEGWRVEGDPTEGALLVVARKAGLDPKQLLLAHPRLDAIPFESERQYMATLHQEGDGSLIYLKGAVERVLSLCEHALDSTGQVVALDRAAVNRVAEDLAREGLRVLAFARKSLASARTDLRPEEVTGEMTFVGLQGMIDPPRSEAVAAVAACKRAGIVVKMITGDHALTAQTIARRMGIGADPPVVVTGAELERLSDSELPWVADRSDVFARVAPEQKLRLVRALQARGCVVAMTGDGVNDAPALKQADIGIAMGVTGTEVAKEAADMVLADDNFASIEAAVEEGRGVYDNLRKFITWTLPTNGGEGLLVIIAIALGMTLPILPVHLLWINMVTAVALGMTLAFEPKERDLMRRPARDPDEPLLTRDLLLRIVYVSVLMVTGAYLLYSWELERGLDPVAARTVVANVIVLVETAYLFNCRSLTQPVWKLGLLSNRWSLLGAAVMVLLQLAFVYLPPMQALFQTAPVPLEAWLDVALVALLVFGVVEVEKGARRRGSWALERREGEKGSSA